MKNVLYLTTLLFFLFLGCKKKKEEAATPQYQASQCHTSSLSYSVDGQTYISEATITRSADNKTVTYNFNVDPDEADERTRKQIFVTNDNYIVTYKYDSNNVEIGIPDTTFLNSQKQIIKDIDHGYTIATATSYRDVFNYTYVNNQMTREDYFVYDQSGTLTYSESTTYYYTNGNCTSQASEGIDASSPTDIDSTFVVFDYFTDYPNPIPSSYSNESGDILIYQYGNPGNYLLKSASYTEKYCNSGSCSAVSTPEVEQYQYQFNSQNKVTVQTVIDDSETHYIKYDYSCN